MEQKIIQPSELLTKCSGSTVEKKQVEACWGPKTVPGGEVVDERATWFRGWLETSVGRVARISTHMGFRDRLGGCRVRWGVRRMHYSVPAGLYAVGQPTPESPASCLRLRPGVWSKKTVRLFPWTFGLAMNLRRQRAWEACFGLLQRFLFCMRTFPFRMRQKMRCGFISPARS